MISNGSTPFNDITFMLILLFLITEIRLDI